jgi:hypothetical protein
MVIENVILTQIVTYNPIPTYKQSFIQHYGKFSRKVSPMIFDVPRMQKGARSNSKNDIKITKNRYIYTNDFGINTESQKNIQKLTL